VAQVEVSPRKAAQSKREGGVPFTMRRTVTKRQKTLGNRQGKMRGSAKGLQVQDYDPSE
jgi:hypothetical protein